MDIEEDKWWGVEVLTQEVKDKEDCQEKQCDDCTAHGVGSRWTGS